MTAPPLKTLLRSRRLSLAAGFLGLGAAIALALAGLFAPSVVLHGWLVAFASVAGLSLGCTAWLAIHALTGGRWGALGRPALAGGAMALPMAALLAVPLVLADHHLYPWAADPSAAGPGVAPKYLNTGFWALRSAVLVCGMSLVAWRARTRPLGPFVAGLALLLYGGLMNLAAYDWLLSLDPRYTSSAIGMQIIALQLLSALCFTVLATEAPAEDAVWGDYGGLILACLLGEAYLILMALVVHWYGDLPDQAAWYLRRTEGGWRWLEIFGVFFGAVLPGVALLFSRVRRSPGPLRFCALAILAGCVAENAWLAAPAAAPDGFWALLAALLALLACGGLMAALAARLGPPLPEAGRATHGV